VIGGLNGAICGWRGTYDWRRRGALAFLLDSTWGLLMTAAALVTHGVAAVQRGRGGYFDELSHRANRHVYAAGFRLRPGFMVTMGNSVNGAGDNALTSTRRRRLVTDHENVHVWQARWFGPLYPVLYVGWTVAAGAIGAALWAVRHRREPFGRVVETCGYYLNPFEWWAYSRGGTWPPTKKVTAVGWNRACVRPLTSVDPP
jgi:hypothetical protein